MERSYLPLRSPKIPGIAVVGCVVGKLHRARPTRISLSRLAILASLCAQSELLRERHLIPGIVAVGFLAIKPKRFDDGQIIE